MNCAQRLAGALKPASSTPAEPVPSTSRGSSRPDSRSGLLRARLSLLPVLALLLGALGLFAAAPAHAQVPAAPTNLSITAAHEALAMTWTAPSGTVTGYDVHYTSAPTSGNGAVTNSAAVQTGGAAAGWVEESRTATDTDAYEDIVSLTNGQAYRVRVRAKNASGAGAWVFGSATPTQPTAPTNLVVTPGNSQLRLSWTAATGLIIGYDVHFTSAARVDVADDAASSGSNPALAWVSSRTTPGDSATSWTLGTHDGVTNGTTYRVRLRAHYTGGETSWVFGTGTPMKPTMSFVGHTALAIEGDGENISVQLSEALASSTTVQIRVAGGSATENTDYRLSTKTLTFAAGVTTKSFTLTALTDEVIDGEETALLNLVAVNNAPYTLADPVQLEVVILDVLPDTKVAGGGSGRGEARPVVDGTEGDAGGLRRALHLGGGGHGGGRRGGSDRQYGDGPRWGGWR